VDRRYGCIGRALLLWLAFVVFAVGGAVLGGHAFGRHRLRAEERAWAAAGLPFDAMLQRWPPSDDSAGARTLDELARPLGLRLVRRPGDDQADPRKELFDELARDLGGDLTVNDRPCRFTSGRARAFLDGHRAEVAALAAHLRSEAALAWRTDLQAGPEAPIPNLLAQRRLHTLLLREALLRIQRGDDAGAEGMLEAAARQLDVLEARPDVISGLIAAGLSFQGDAVLRCLPLAAPAWDARLQGRSFRTSMSDRLGPEAYGYIELARQGRGIADLDRAGPLDPTPSARLLRAFTVPYVRLGVAGVSRQARRLRELALHTDFCRVPSEPLREAFTEGIPRRDFLARIAVPSLAGSSATGTAVDLEGELTGLVLQLRRRMRRGELGTGAPFDVASAVCPGMSWQHGRLADGSWLVRAAPGPVLSRGKRQWEYTLTAAQR
jgi:hypothetical protein